MTSVVDDLSCQLVGTNKDLERIGPVFAHSIVGGLTGLKLVLSAGKSSYLASPPALKEALDQRLASK
eukprot:4534452-Prorocentrum_lima.AAC.1